MSDGAEGLHYILELPADSPAFRHDVEAALGFARNPLYAVLQEACWADGGATRWAAQRLLPSAYEDEPELFFGEHVYPWMFEDYGALAPLREAADILAAHEWPRLYDPERLAANEVPVAAAIYAEDMYVERAFSEETAARDPRPAAVAHQRARAQRPARRRRAHPRPPDRPRAREGVRWPRRTGPARTSSGPRTLHRPTTHEQLREIVARAPRVRVLGSRHSFSDIADSAELVSLEGLPADVERRPRGGHRVLQRRAEVRRAGHRAGGARASPLHNLASLPHISSPAPSPPPPTAPATPTATWPRRSAASSS